MKQAALVAVAALGAIAAFATERFGHEFCHHGIPLAATAIGAPLVGVVAAFFAVGLRPPRWMFGVNTALAGLNIWYVANAIKVLAGVGFLTCR